VSAADTREFLVEVFVTLKPAVNDPAGLAITAGLHSLGFDEVDAVRQGKYLRIRLRAASRQQAEQRVEAMCERLLANTVIEQYRVTVESSTALAAS
jgi:phosphoribosylformylglycinamidine synthase subunit PurS